MNKELYKNKVGFVLIILIFASILFSRAGLSILPIFSLIFSIYVYYENKKSEFKISGFQIICLIYFFLILVSLLWSENVRYGVEMIEKKMYFLLFPIIFLFLNSSFWKPDLKKVFTVFNSILVFYCLLMISQSMMHVVANDLPLEYFYTKMIRFRLHQVISFPVHHSYLGVIINTMLFFTLKSSKRAINKILVGTLFVFVLYLNSSISSFLCLLIISGYFFYGYLKKRSLITRLLSILFLSISCMMVLFFLAKDYRKMGYWESPLYRISRVFNEGDPTRIENWKSSISVIQENYLMGTGVGDEIDELQKKRNPETYVYQEKLNTHNQFLAEFVRTGIIGIILLIYMLIYMFRKSYKNPISIMFVIFMTVCFFTENIIDRQRGIVFFLLISELLFLETKYKSNTFAKNFSRLT